MPDVEGDAVVDHLLAGRGRRFLEIDLRIEISLRLEIFDQVAPAFHQQASIHGALLITRASTGAVCRARFSRPWSRTSIIGPLSMSKRRRDGIGRVMIVQSFQ